MEVVSGHLRALTTASDLRELLLKTVECTHVCQIMLQQLMSHYMFWQVNGKYIFILLFFMLIKMGERITILWKKKYLRLIIFQPPYKALFWDNMYNLNGLNYVTFPIEGYLIQGKDFFKQSLILKHAIEKCVQQATWISFGIL